MTIEFSKLAFVLTLIGLEYLSITYYLDLSLSVMHLFLLNIINIREIQRGNKIKNRQYKDTGKYWAKDTGIHKINKADPIKIPAP